MFNQKAYEELTNALQSLTPDEFKDYYSQYWYSENGIEGVALSLSVDGWHVFTLSGEVVIDLNKKYSKQFSENSEN
ncbi:hypothetical protein P4H82_26760 [Bacillus cereus]|nr:hypothetical protein [Bacillus cereus]